MDRETVIKALENCVLTDDCRSCEYWIERDDHDCQIMKDALELLKEQDDLGTELTNAMELIHKKNERIKNLEEQLEAITKRRMNAGAFD